MARNFDFIIVGGGIVGLTAARELLKRGHRAIAIFEKEPTFGLHASGRNSGVLHAGIYYSKDSIKAKVCASGAKLMQEYAAERGIRVLKTGKVIVAPTPEQVPQLKTIHDRAVANRITVEKIDLKQLKEIEPEAFSHECALFSPTTAIIDTQAVLKSLEADLTAAGVAIFKSEGVESVDASTRTIRTRSGVASYGHLINTAGLHADRIAHEMGVGTRYRILPFKGIYRKLKKEAASRFRGLIYPTPDLRVPFLGVHVTKTIDGGTTLGPTALPAFGRENYGLIQGISPVEMPRMVWELSAMMARNQDGFRTMVMEELPRYSTGGFLEAARQLAPSLSKADLSSEGKVGLRAQLVDVREMKLEMDFVVETGTHSTHVLNAVSPAFTASMAFAKMVADRALQ